MSAQAYLIDGLRHTDQREKSGLATGSILTKSWQAFAVADMRLTSRPTGL